MSKSKATREAAERELEKLAWAMARVPTRDRHGLQTKAAAYAHLIGARISKRPETAAEAVLLSLIFDLLRGTPDEELLGIKRRKLPVTRSMGRPSVEIIPIDLRRLQQLAAADEFLADLVGEYPYENAE
jgi:hypothetical protein